MDRYQRIILRCKKNANSNEILDAIEKAADIAGVSVEEFVNWSFENMAHKLKEERMNQRIMIENAIRNLGIRLPNGTVNKEYKAYFQIPSEIYKDIRNVEIIGLEELGLSLDSDDKGNFQISGRPNNPGDYRLKFKYETLAGEPVSEIEFPLAFNPDPRKLWRNIPTDKDIPYYKPDSHSEFIKVIANMPGKSSKDLVAASQRGRSHAQEGKARDDHFALFYDNDSEWYVVAVADGAGSAKYSRKGSEVACKTVVDYCKNLLSNDYSFDLDIEEWAANRENDEKRKKVTQKVIEIIFKGAVKAHEAVRKVAEAHPDSKLKDYATTLMFAICKKFNFGWFIASFWVGDGAMCIYNEYDNTIKLLGVPDEGEFSGQTRFLTMTEIFHEKDILSKRIRMTIVEDFTALFLMTDGVSDPMFETDNNLNNAIKWKEFYQKLRNGFPEDDIEGVDLADDNEDAKDQLLKWLDFWSPGNHDDRTIAILY